MQYFISALIGYILGCSSMSFYISKIKNIDIKKRGSKNYGASNTIMLAGFKAGALVFIHDLSKSILAILIAKWLFPNNEIVGVLAGCFAVVGHIFPFYLKFDGGKGFASFIGVIIALQPIYGLILFIATIIFALIVDYIVGSTFTLITAAPIMLFFTNGLALALIVAATSALIVFKHKENIINLATQNGKEAKISNVLRKKK